MTDPVAQFISGKPLKPDMQAVIHVAQTMAKHADQVGVPKRRRWRRMGVNWVPLAREVVASLFVATEGRRIVRDITAPWPDDQRASRPPMREWVVGFLIDEHRDSVVLIRKNRPPWQRGKLNGVGGKIEPGETPEQAMEREFLEETGMRFVGWEEFVTLTAVSTEDRTGAITSEQGVVHFFRYITPFDFPLRSATDEQVLSVPIDAVAAGDVDTIPNLQWLVPLAAHHHDTYEPIQVIELSTTLRVNA